MNNHIKVLQFDINEPQSKPQNKSQPKVKPKQSNPKKPMNKNPKPTTTKVSSPQNPKLQKKPRTITNNHNKLNQKKQLYNIEDYDDIGNIDDLLIQQDEYENIIQPKKIKNEKEKKKEEKMINTIKMVSENRMKYQRTNQILREIGQIANKPQMGFLIEREDASPSKKLSAFISHKMKENNRLREEKKYTDDDEYYKNLELKIKEEIKKKGTFDFSKLSDTDRKLLAEKKLYSKMKNQNEQKKIEEVNEEEKLNSKEEKERLRKMQRENFFKSLEEEEDKKEKIEKEDIINDNYNFNDNGNNKNEQLNARQILENVLAKIEYKNQQLVNHNEELYKKRIKKKK